MRESTDFNSDRDLEQERFIFQNKLSKDDWDEKVSEIRNLPSLILDEVDAIYGEDSDVWTRAKREFNKRLTSSGLQKEQLRQIAAWNLLVGSSPLYDINPVFDLPGDLSIVKFMEDFLEKLKEMHE